MLFAELTGEVTVLESVLTPSPQNSFFAGTRYHTRLLAKPWERANSLRCAYFTVFLLYHRDVTGIKVPASFFLSDLKVLGFQTPVRFL